MNLSTFRANYASALPTCLLALALLCALLAGCGADSHSRYPSDDEPFGYRILEIAEHDRTLFTQGLEIASGFFYESAGLYGQSRIRRYLPSGEIHAEFQLPDNEFAEGLSVNDELAILLTWQNRKVYFLDKKSLQPRAIETIAHEGWGAAFIDERLAISNGTDIITMYQLAPFMVQSKIQVTGFGRSWQKINELEYAKGLLWANIWQENVIIAINPTSGQVVHQFDLTAVVEQNTQVPFRESLNGIAYDERHDGFWLTGKLWSKRYLVEFDLNQ